MLEFPENLGSDSLLGGGFTGGSSSSDGRGVVGIGGGTSECASTSRVLCVGELSLCPT